MKKNLALSLMICGLGLGLGGLGCGAGDSGATTPPPTQPGKSVWSTSTTTLVAADQGGGFVPQPPPGSTCTVNAKKFTLTVATRSVAWTRCVGDGKVAYMETSGTQTLSETDYKNLLPLLENLMVVKPDGGCIADASMLTLNVTTPLGAQDYVDDGFQCQVTDKPLLDRGTLFGVIDRLNKLTTPSM